MVRAAVSTEPSDPSPPEEAAPAPDGAPEAPPAPAPEEPPKPDAPQVERSTGWRAWWFLAVPLLALFELGAEWVIEARVPTPDHWRAAHNYIAHEKRDGDLVASAPLWTDPLARMYFRDLITLRDAARPDATRYARAWVATIRGGEHPDFKGWREQLATSFGRVTVRLLVNPSPARVLYDFADHVRPPDASVLRVEGDARRDCNFQSGLVVAGGGLGQGALAGPERFMCGEPWNYVGVTILEDMEHRGRRCIWSHPAQGATMVTSFENVPMGARLHGHHAIAYEAERGDDFGNDLGGPVELRVLVDGQPVGTSIHHDNEGWKVFDFDTSAYAGAAHRVSFEVRSDRAGMRHYCFEGDTR